jgi:hypothetical protein
MKIEVVNGCMAYDFEIDGKSIHECTIDELKDALTKSTAYVVSKANDERISDLKTAIRNLVELFGDCECLEDACECCGDFVETYTIEI